MIGDVLTGVSFSIKAAVNRFQVPGGAREAGTEGRLHCPPPGCFSSRDQVLWKFKSQQPEVDCVFEGLLDSAAAGEKAIPLHYAILPAGLRPDIRCAPTTALAAVMDRWSTMVTLAFQDAP